MYMNHLCFIHSFYGHLSWVPLMAIATTNIRVQVFLWYICNLCILFNGFPFNSHPKFIAFFSLFLIYFLYSAGSWKLPGDYLRFTIPFLQSSSSVLSDYFSSTYFGHYQSWSNLSCLCCLKKEFNVSISSKQDCVYCFRFSSFVL
jgi:hypothetical protein